MQNITTLALIIILPVLLAIPSSYAEGRKPIPDPLSLDVALEFARKSHPTLTTANLNIQSAINSKNEVESDNDFDVYLEGRLRYIEPSTIAFNQNKDDHRAGIIITKTLYDFGRIEASIQSADLTIKAEEVIKKRVILERRLDIMQRFYDVILADMNFYRYNEAMATEAVSLDRLKDKLDVGQTSDIDIMKQDVEYKKMRYLRIRSQNEQRITRANLAIAMGRPSELVATVNKPQIKFQNTTLPDIDELTKISLSSNYEMNTLAFKLAAARADVVRARKIDSPTINIEAGSYAYSRETQRSDQLQLALVLNVPLFSGHESDIETAKALNKVHLIEADIALVKARVSAEILRLWFEFDALKGKLLQMEALTDYRELYLDRSRALYELEVKTDLGDAMVRVSEAEREFMKTQYQIMIVIAQLELTVGKTLKLINNKKSGM